MALAACGGPRSDGGDWTSYGRSADESRFSPGNQITSDNVDRLGLSWAFTLDEPGGLEATPLAIDGILYFTAANGTVYAADVLSRKILWKYDPQSWKVSPRMIRGFEPVNRGLAYWQGKLFLGAFDGRLIAIDARNGREIWQTSTLDGDGPHSRKTITGAPRAFNGKVVIGQGGADWGTRGYLTAYDANSGKKLWRFFTVPGRPGSDENDPAMKMAAKSWSGEWWRWGGGGTPWNAITYDPELNRLYIGTGNASVYDPRLRSPAGGDNLFLASIVAVDVDTGRYIWHYQVNPREAWDYKATTDMTLAEAEIGGKRRKILMQAPTNGFFYVLDRETGRVISAEKLGKVTWADKIDLKTGRPVERPGIRYESGPVTIWPGTIGAHNWQAMAYSPQTKLVYIPYMQLPTTFTSTPEDAQALADLTLDKTKMRFGIGATFRSAVIDKEDGKGALLAWDPIGQKAAWRVPRKYLWNGGILTTGGNLVFQGTADGNFEAFSADQGKLLWSFKAGNGIIAPPISFAARGKQYIAVLAGYGGASAAGSKLFDTGWRYGIHPSRLLVFSLDGKEKLPQTQPPSVAVTIADDPKIVIDQAAAKRGAKIYSQTCRICHGAGAAATGPTAPDLRASGATLDYAVFRDVLNGALVERQMPRFDDLSDDEMRSIFMYIRSEARHPGSTGEVKQSNGS
ncbi:PQQ-dependent dehydrogenase, methanol/ethanol family [Sphingobium subterraneum]|uniref:PQQ-dependent dehydrogenase, methanol/ethanol family n=1 Tax=Sphingobium subterraneum TaxID=627688 RepID=UPI0016099AE5|nr:PQQ-dependent dehydrogenase, methanol/ethanol family [Sphingobium subterraneum]